jgi:hypothetical protein
MKPSEMKTNSGINTALKIELTPQQVTNFHNSFNINADSEKEPAKILSAVLNNTVNLTPRKRQIFRSEAPIYNDYMKGGTGDDKEELSIHKINSNLSKLCTQGKELKDKDGKGLGIFLIPFKIADRSYCWTLLSKQSLEHQLQIAKGEKIKDKK